ncbi:MAG: VWA domain-containing protein [Halanaerobacter sp.]
MFRLLHWYFLLLIPVLIYIYFKSKTQGKLKFSSLQLFKESGVKKTYKHKIGKYLILLGLILLIVALARPQIAEQLKNVKKKGLDIVLALDVSESMRSVDFEPHRLQVAKNVANDFITERPSDRLGLVIFSGTAYTRIPLTLDHNILTESLEQITTEDVNQEGTAIGMGVSIAINRLKKSDAQSKVIILLTDGENNVGEINPATAAELAEEMGIKIYTIGVGSDETILPVKVRGTTRYKRYEGGLDEELLREIAQKTGGQYFRAKDKKALKTIFAKIDKLEKTEFKDDNYFEYHELAFGLIKAALFLILIGIFLDRYLYLKIP